MTLDAYTLTWDEVLAEGEARKNAVVSIDGYLLCSSDRKLDLRKAAAQHLFSVAHAIAAGKPVPGHVRAWYEETIKARGIAPDHARRAAFDPPGGQSRDHEARAVTPALGNWREEVGSDPRPTMPSDRGALSAPQKLVNAKGKPFSWSPSAISDFITCPAQYAARRFYETLPYVETEAMKQGTIEHKHLEDRLALKKPLPSGYERGEKYCAAFERSGAVITAEQELAITEDLQFVSWFDKSAWGRCKIDVTLLFDGGFKLAVYDWKTGKPKDDLLQLKINTWMLSLKHPEVETFVNRFIWLKFDEVTPKKGEGEFTRSDLPTIAEEILAWIERMKQAWQTETFQPRASGLCKSYCSVTSCAHCGKGGR